MPDDDMIRLMDMVMSQICGWYLVGALKCKAPTGDTPTRLEDRHR